MARLAHSIGDDARVDARRHQAEVIAAALPPLQVAADHIAETVAQGIHGRRRVGLGETFWQYRRYYHGDQPSRIDWRRSARGDQVYIRETEWEAAQSVWLWRDVSASMAYQSQRGLPTKRDQADLLTMAAMSLLVRGGERIALLGQPDPPATGRAAFNRLSLAIAMAGLAAASASDGAGVTGDADRAGRGEGAEDGSLPALIPLPRYATLILIGDFLSPLDDIMAAIRFFGERGVRGHMIQVLDPAESSMPFVGRSRFTGLEAEGDLLVGRAESLREDYLGRLDRHQDALRQMARLTGWTFAVHHTDQPPGPALLALYRILTDQPDA